MKNFAYAILLTFLFISCQYKKEATYLPRTLSVNEDFNYYPKANDKVLTVVKYNGEKSEAKSDQEEESYGVKFGDTTIRIQANKSDNNSAIDKFAFAQFVNTQKTALLVQMADASGLVAPFYLITIKEGRLEVVSLYRPSKGKLDRKITKGLVKVGSTGHLINNDFFVTNVNAKVYLIKRQNPEERIQGDFLVKSADKRTFVFLMSSSLYEVNYPTDETFTQPLSSKVPATDAALYAWIQANFSWQKNKAGISFLKSDADDNRVVDISAFK